MPTFGQTFPPKFSENLLYPNVLNLDQYEIPAEFDYYSAGTYFNIGWPHYTLNESPYLTYGKHVFNIYTEEINSANLPNLQVGSRILFEFKDSAGTVIFSDIISNYSNNKYVGYVWLKGDPLRTYDDIQQGAATMTIVAKNQTSDINWRNRYNVRITFPFQIDLYTENTEAQTITYTKNPSPVYFQYPLASMGSGSGLFMSQSVFEVIEEGNPTPIQHNQLIVSASRLRTYSGKVDMVKAEFKLKSPGGSTENLDESAGFSFLYEYVLTHDSRSRFESQIGLDYAQGINTLSDVWAIDLTAMFDELDGHQDPYVKFKLTFYPPTQDWFDTTSATDIFTGNEVSLIYPLGADNWMSVEQGARSMANTTYRSMDKSNKTVVETNAGMYDYRSGYLSIGPNRGGITYNSDGNMTGWGPGQANCELMVQGCGDSSTD